MLRGEVARGTALGRMIASYLDSGRLVCDELVNQAVGERIQEPDCGRGLILDGYPRSLSQARFLDGVMNSRDRTVVIEIEVSCEELLPRLMARRYCPDCGATFSLQGSAQPVRTCTSCGVPLQQRTDDREDVIRSRFDEYQQVTAPLVAHYMNQGTFHRIPGALPVTQVFTKIESVVRETLALTQMA
jgi:adenylate kinase